MIERIRVTPRGVGLVEITDPVVDCVERVQLNTRVQSITAPDDAFEVATIDDPFAGQTSTVVAPGETMFVTLRVV